MIGPQDIWVGPALGIFFFGARKLPELSRSLGQALSEFKKGVSGTEADSSPSAERSASRCRSYAHEAGRARSALIRRDAPSPDVGRRSGLGALAAGC